MFKTDSKILNWMGNKYINEIVTKDLNRFLKELSESLDNQVKSFASLYLEYKDGKFVKHQLPNEVQVSPINQILINDFDKDGHLDIVTAGNLYASEVETPRADAGYGLLLKGNGKGSFAVVPSTESGLYTHGDVKDLITITVKNQNYIISAKNSDFLQFIKYNL